MYYYVVWVRSARYHGNEGLTYSHAEALALGSLVSVPLKQEVVPGIVFGIAHKTTFAIKPIKQVYALPPLPKALLETGRWLAAYYPAPIGLITQQLLPASLGKVPTETTPLDVTMPDLSALPPLTSEQRAALQDIAQPGSYLLHGKTGSGKTRLYIELAARSLAAGSSAIVLTPEISLISQLAENFGRVFGKRVVVLHSRLAPAERRQRWLSILGSRQPLIVIGPRSALFSPLPRLGLIVIDEAHEPAYKQQQAPRYQTGRVAAYLALSQPATLIIGSATPSVSDYFLAEQKQRPIIKLNSSALPTMLPAIAVIDLKDRSLFGRSSLLSESLLAAIEQALSNKEQALLYLNRRGTARMILCEKCGWQALCPRCDLPLTYHGDSHDLRCHACSHHEIMPAACPNCRHPSILLKTAGTKAIVGELDRLFPQARIQRFDTDNLKAERFEQHYQAVRGGEVDILVGTQLLAKGLDLPRLSTIGVVLADTSLSLPDFSAQERTYQLLTQVLGRIGRGHTEGQAIIQTYRPDNPTLRAAVSNDWDSFYHNELRERRLFRFPPFYYLLQLNCRRKTAAAAQKAAQNFKDKLQAAGQPIIVEGPAPAFHEKLSATYSWQLVVKATQRSQLLAVIASLPKNGWSHDIDAVDLL